MQNPGPLVCGYHVPREERSVRRALCRIRLQVDEATRVCPNRQVLYGAPGNASRFENDVWMYLARIHGPENVRGGDVTIVQRGTDAIPDWILPQEFGGHRIVNWGVCPVLTY